MFLFLPLLVFGFGFGFALFVDFVGGGMHVVVRLCFLVVGGGGGGELFSRCEETNGCRRK